MAFQLFVSKISEKFFEQKKNKNPVITPILDPELGNIIHCKQVSSECIYPDLELGFGPVIEANCGDVIINIHAFEQCRIIENYVSFMEAITYLSMPIKDRIGMNMHLSFIFEADEDVLPRYKNNNESHNYNRMNMADDNHVIDIPLHLSIDRNL
jgi:hypothetical protein